MIELPNEIKQFILEYGIDETFNVQKESKLYNFLINWYNQLYEPMYMAKEVKQDLKTNFHNYKGIFLSNEIIEDEKFNVVGFKFVFMDMTIEDEEGVEAKYIFGKTGRSYSFIIGNNSEETDGCTNS